VPRPTPASRKGTPLLPLYIILGLVALAGIYFLFAQTRKTGGGVMATAPVAVNMTPEQIQRVPGVSRGSASAPITLFEFADFTCPGCRQFNIFLEPMIRDSLVNTGRVRFVYYDFPLGGGAHRHGFVAARAARCADAQGKFWEMHDALFTHQGEWSFVNDPVELFTGYAREVGVEPGAFSQCVRSDRFAQEVSASREFGLSLAVNSTPTLVANGQRLEHPNSFSDLEAQLRRIAPAAFAIGAAPAGDSASAARTDSAPAPVPADSAPR
jgi:protein-disulfide isomerase